jgi:hypothetical protein
MLCREIIDVCSEIHTQKTERHCGRTVTFVNVKPDDPCKDLSIKSWRYMELQQCSQCTHLIQGWLVPRPGLGAVQCKISCRWWESKPLSPFHHPCAEKWLIFCQVRWQTDYEKRLLNSSCLPSVRPYHWNSTPIGIHFVDFDIVSLLVDSILVKIGEK